MAYPVSYGSGQEEDLLRRFPMGMLRKTMSANKGPECVPLVPLCFMAIGHWPLNTPRADWAPASAQLQQQQQHVAQVADGHCRQSSHEPPSVRDSKRTLPYLRCQAIPKLGQIDPLPASVVAAAWGPVAPDGPDLIASSSSSRLSVRINTE